MDNRDWKKVADKLADLRDDLIKQRDERPCLTRQQTSIILKALKSIDGFGNDVDEVEIIGKLETYMLRTSEERDGLDAPEERIRRLGTTVLGWVGTDTPETLNAMAERVEDTMGHVDGQTGRGVAALIRICADSI